MRVLTIGSMYPPHHLGGYELMWRSSVESLREDGHEVRVLTTDVRRPEADGVEDLDIHRELEWYWRDHEWPRMSPVGRFRLEFRNRSTLLRHLREFSPDVIAWWAMGGMSLSLIEQARRRGVPGVGVVVDDWLIYGPEVDGWLRGTRRLRGVGGVVDRLTGIPTRLEVDENMAWVVVSQSVLEHSRNSGWKLSRSHVAHAGADLGLFRPAPAKDWSWRLVVVGRIDPRKGIATAIRAVAELPQASLDIVGGGDERYRAELEELIVELGVANRVWFRSAAREKLPAVYSSADVVLFPVVWHEPFGIVPLEAMAVGRPVIATGMGGSGEYLRHDENCLVFSPQDDSKALAAAVRRLAGDDRLRERLREGGFETSTENGEDRFNQAVASALERAAE